MATRLCKSRQPLGPGAVECSSCEEKEGKESEEEEEEEEKEEGQCSGMIFES